MTKESCPLCNLAQNTMMPSSSGLANIPFIPLGTLVPTVLEEGQIPRGVLLNAAANCMWSWQQAVTLTHCCSPCSLTLLPSHGIYLLEWPEHCSWTTARCDPSCSWSVMLQLSLGWFYHQVGLLPCEWPDFSITEGTKSDYFSILVYNSEHAWVFPACQPSSYVLIPTFTLKSVFPMAARLKSPVYPASYLQWSQIPCGCMALWVLQGEVDQAPGWSTLAAKTPWMQMDSSFGKPSLPPFPRLLTIRQLLGCVLLTTALINSPLS